jgi:hypothetical protein
LQESVSGIVSCAVGKVSGRNRCDATKKRFSAAAPALPGRDMVILMKKLAKITGI